MADNNPEAQSFDPQQLTGRRLGPYCSFNPVSRTQVWQWCSAMGDQNPLYLDDQYRTHHGYDRLVAPPAMMQMWTMRDVHGNYAPGSTGDAPYQVFDTLKEHGYPGNVAVSYDITFHRLLQEGDRAHHYHTISAISELKKTALGVGYFVTQHAEFLDQQDRLYAEAFITYFQYQPAAASTTPAPTENDATANSAATWQPDFSNLAIGDLHEGDALPQLVIPITRKLIVSGAIATQDFIDVHHNVPAARAAAMPDIFMNILTTCGLCGRYLSDWAGPASRLKKLSFKLMSPNLPGDTMVFDGQVKALTDNPETKLVDVEFAGSNSLGIHVAGQATLTLGS